MLPDIGFSVDPAYWGWIIAILVGTLALIYYLSPRVHEFDGNLEKTRFLEHLRMGMRRCTIVTKEGIKVWVHVIGERVHIGFRINEGDRKYPDIKYFFTYFYLESVLGSSVKRKKAYAFIGDLISHVAIGTVDNEKLMLKEIKWKQFSF